MCLSIIPDWQKTSTLVCSPSIEVLGKALLHVFAIFVFTKVRFGGKNLVFPINSFRHPKWTWNSEWWRHAYNTHLLPYSSSHPICSKCLISAWAIIKEAIQKHEGVLLLSGRSSSCTAFCPNAWMKSLHANDQGAKCPWGLRCITFSGPLAAKGAVPPAPVPWAGYEYELGEGLVLQCRASVWLWGC